MSSVPEGRRKAAQPSPAQKAQQERMTACNKQATEKKLKGERAQEVHVELPEKT
jgi:hypothetical protein